MHVKTHLTAQKDFLQERFRALLERQGISLAQPRGRVACLFHQDTTPSLSIDTERGLFHCFGCGVGGGVRDFARLVGEEWTITGSETHTPALRRERARMAVEARRRTADATARAILQRRKDERDKARSRAYREAHAIAVDCGDLLALFHRRPDLAEEFHDVVKQTERDYADALFQCSLVEAQLAREV